jgi:hypothetical protein
MRAPRRAADTESTPRGGLRTHIPLLQPRPAFPLPPRGWSGRRGGRDCQEEVPPAWTQDRALGHR